MKALPVFALVFLLSNLPASSLAADETDKEPSGTAFVVSMGWLAGERGDVINGNVSFAVRRIGSAGNSYERLDQDWRPPVRPDLTPNITYLGVTDEQTIVLTGNDLVGPRVKIRSAMPEERRRNHFAAMLRFSPFVSCDEEEIRLLEKGKWKTIGLAEPRDILAQLEDLHKRQINHEISSCSTVVHDAVLDAQKVVTCIDSRTFVSALDVRLRREKSITQWMFRVLEWGAAGNNGEVFYPKQFLLQKRIFYVGGWRQNRRWVVVGTSQFDLDEQASLTNWKKLLPVLRTTDLVGMKAIAVEPTPKEETTAWQTLQSTDDLVTSLRVDAIAKMEANVFKPVPFAFPMKKSTEGEQIKHLSSSLLTETDLSFKTPLQVQSLEGSDQSRVLSKPLEDGQPLILQLADEVYRQPDRYMPQVATAVAPTDDQRSSARWRHSTLLVVSFSLLVVSSISIVIFGRKGLTPIQASSLSTVNKA